jgi:hypothetical protein
LFVSDDFNRRAGREAEFLPVAETGRVVVLGLANDYSLPRAEVAEGVEVAVAQFTRLGWNGVAVRVFERLAQVRRDGLFQTRGDGVFESLGLGVHLAPVEAEYAREEQLDETVAADDAEGFA